MFSEVLKPPVESEGGKIYMPREEARMGRTASVNPITPIPAQPYGPCCRWCRLRTGRQSRKLGKPHVPYHLATP